MESKQEAIKWISENGRYTINIEFAKELCKLCNIPFSDSLIRTSMENREVVFSGKENEPRVDVTTIAEHIAKKLHIKPDKKLMETADKMIGIGSSCDLSAQAYMKEVLE